MIACGWVLEHIEMQGRRANDAKHSASWEATQVFLNYVVSSSIGYFQRSVFLAESMISVSACWFNFRTRKRRCKSCRMLNVQSEVYKWRVLEKLGC